MLQFSLGMKAELPNSDGEFKTVCEPSSPMQYEPTFSVQVEYSIDNSLTWTTLADIDPRALNSHAG